MSTPINNGGPAFPAYINTPSGLVADALRPGMNLRDYFAGQALNGWLSSFTTSDGDPRPEAVARFCYRIADAMIAARRED
jgi:hypothetical protein